MNDLSIVGNSTTCNFSVGEGEEEEEDDGDDDDNGILVISFSIIFYTALVIFLKMKTMGTV